MNKDAAPQKIKEQNSNCDIAMNEFQPWESFENFDILNQEGVVEEKLQKMDEESTK